MIYQSVILEVGEDAELFLEDKMMVLFNETVPEELKSIAIVHEHKQMDGEIKKGDFLGIGDASYQVLAVGDKANETMKEMGHCTIKFGEPSESDLPGMIIVEDGKIGSLVKDLQIMFFRR